MHQGKPHKTGQQLGEAWKKSLTPKMKDANKVLEKTKSALTDTALNVLSVVPIPLAGAGLAAKGAGKVLGFIKNILSRGSGVKTATKAIAKSKPVNFKGPNPAHKTGAGGNSYSTQSMMRKQKPGEEIYRGDGKWYRGDGSMGQNLDIQKEKQSKLQIT